MNYRIKTIEPTSITGGYDKVKFVAILPTIGVKNILYILNQIYFYFVFMHQQALRYSLDETITIKNLKD
jgi:hypothetical protein